MTNPGNAKLVRCVNFQRRGQEAGTRGADNAISCCHNTVRRCIRKFLLVPSTQHSPSSHEYKNPLSAVEAVPGLHEAACISESQHGEENVVSETTSCAKQDGHQARLPTGDGRCRWKRRLKVSENRCRGIARCAVTYAAQKPLYLVRTAPEK